MFLFAVLLVSCIGFVSGASAEVLTRVRASGMGLISGGDRAAAFDQAKRAALREAVEIGVGTLVSAETRVDLHKLRTGRLRSLKTSSSLGPMATSDLLRWSNKG